MESDYGALKETVAIAGSLIAAGSAIALPWTRRAKWMPPVETVPAATAKVSGLLCAVAIGALYLQRVRIGQDALLLIAGCLIGVTLLALVLSIYVNTAYGFTFNERRVL